MVSSQPEDDDECALVRHLAYSLTGALGDETIQLAAAPGTVDALLAALEADRRPVRLVVDDLHVIAGTRAEAALERVAMLAPGTFGCRGAAVVRRRSTPPD